MNKLKTLKDLELKFPVNFERYHDIRRSDFEMIKGQLRVEAIKWVKKACNCSYPDPCDCWPEKFMEFFNLTEADLTENNGGKDD